MEKICIVRRRQQTNFTEPLWGEGVPAVLGEPREEKDLMLRLNFSPGESKFIPLADPEKGTLTLVYQEVGKTTLHLSTLNVGDKLTDLVGPLGKPTHIEKFGTVVGIGGGLGIAPLHPIIQAMKKAGSILSEVIRDHPLEKLKTLGQLRSAWTGAVGETVSAHAQPVDLREGTLVVQVDTSVWMQQLHFMRDTILEKLNLSLFPKPLRGIRFKIGPVPGPKILEEPLPPLSPQNLRTVEEAAAAIQDPEVRTAFKGLMEAYLKNRQEH